jgi:hypothetical protein
VKNENYTKKTYRDKILIVDYISWTDQKGLPVGHALKAMEEYAEWISKAYDIVFAAHVAYLRDIIDKEGTLCTLSLPYHLYEGDEYASLRGKIKQLFISWINIKSAFKEKESKYVWFSNVDIFLFFYLLFHKKQRKKTIITTYLARFPKKYHNAIVDMVLPDIKLLIYSNREIAYIGNNKIYIPDYLYVEEKYKKYRKKNKKQEAVCLGKMGPQKELRRLVCAFNANGFPLKIIGKFSDNGLFRELKEKAYSNVIIEDKYLCYDDYLKILGEAEYSILPYKEEIYSDKTSGVLLESIFLDAIPITNIKLLQKWKVSGIGYKDINELGAVKMDTANKDSNVQNNRDIIKRYFTPENYIKKLKKILSE